MKDNKIVQQIWTERSNVLLLFILIINVIMYSRIEKVIDYSHVNISGTVESQISNNERYAVPVQVIR